ncbi:OmpH family outer membrane protein [Epibacterium sp. SM1969]|uniref:OmpH family outer membrane protein n=1 Tax=Tritonibacter aquimaris TaxID=2663379 RepID=A0A844ASI2_9RHOB|nr:OmpH family outer membrane protein [Tritonibacter aquimaris]
MIHTVSVSLKFALGAALIGALPGVSAFAQTAEPQPHLGFGGASLQMGVPLSGVLTLRSDVLFNESAFGQRIAREIDAEGAVLTAENRRIEAELRAEEQELTRRRPDMAPEDFRRLADAFDEKVQQNRRAQDTKLSEINQMNEDARREFLTVSLPVLQEIMREAGAGAILEKSNVFLSSDAADITQLAIQRVDAVLGDGSTSRNRE